MYVWADGAPFKVRLGEDRLCCLVIAGVQVDETKELVAVAHGYWKPTESCRALGTEGLNHPVPLWL